MTKEHLLYTVLKAISTSVVVGLQFVLIIVERIGFGHEWLVFSEQSGWMSKHHYDFL